MQALISQDLSAYPSADDVRKMGEWSVLPRLGMEKRVRFLCLECLFPPLSGKSRPFNRDSSSSRVLTSDTTGNISSGARDERATDTDCMSTDDEERRRRRGWSMNGVIREHIHIYTRRTSSSCSPSRSPCHALESLAMQEEKKNRENRECVSTSCARQSVETAFPVLSHTLSRCPHTHYPRSSLVLLTVLSCRRRRLSSSFLSRVLHPRSSRLFLSVCM